MLQSISSSLPLETTSGSSSQLTCCIGRGSKYQAAPQGSLQEERNFSNSGMESSSITQQTWQRKLLLSGRCMVTPKPSVILTIVLQFLQNIAQLLLPHGQEILLTNCRTKQLDQSSCKVETIITIIVFRLEQKVLLSRINNRSDKQLIIWALKCLNIV